jgi:hypothetical protein
MQPINRGLNGSQMPVGQIVQEHALSGHDRLHRATILAGHLVLQRKRADCGIASSVIAGLCGQNANRQSKHERGGGDDYAFGHHGSPLSF